MALTQTTLAAPIGPSDTQVQLASVSGILRGWLLYIGGEAMTVVASPVSTTTVSVARGAGGTRGAAHSDGTVYAGAPNLFYSMDPVGSPNAYPEATPWINLRTGTVWAAVGDEVGPNAGSRFWQPINTLGISGALGVRGTLTTA